MEYKFRKIVPISLPVQLIQLNRIYGNLIINSGIKRSELFCDILLTPSIESVTYQVLITYNLSNHFPHSWLIKPQIELYDGKLPKHLYRDDTNKHPQLCVFYPKAGEWGGQMLLATSYIPWVITWLNAYEYWLITGKWIYPEIMHGTKINTTDKNV